MGARTSQLQIRVTPAEKAVLKRLAEAAGETVSGYVLSRVLPSSEAELAALMSRLGEADVVDSDTIFREIAEALEEIPPDELREAVPEPAADTTPPVFRNRLAALVEADAKRRGGRVPSWTRTVPPLPRPHFDWSLTSLKPHQLRVTPVAFKKRNLFFDPAVAATGAFASLRMDIPPENGGPERARRELELFVALGHQLASSHIEVEFYSIGGALLFQAFAAAPATARVSALFEPASSVKAAVEAVARARGVPESWPHECTRALLQPMPGDAATGYVELPGVRVFEPLPEYVLAVKCAAMRLGTAFQETDDVRYVLRAMNVTTTDVALSLVGSYFAERQLAHDTRARLEAILPS